MNFESLVGRINLIQDALQAQAAHAVNLSLTARNWLVGYYIVEFEQHGEDRAKYGEKLINRLAERINRKGFEPRSLRVYRRIYLVYPQLGTVIETYLQKNSLMLSDSGVTSIWQSLPAELQATENQMDGIWRSALAKLEEWSTPADRLFYKLNYTCLAYLTSIEDPLKRAFYEQETIRGCWTSRELDRQVSSQYYERMGLSKDKKALQRLTAKNAQQVTPRDILHNPVTLEFLGMEQQDVYTETKLETAILNNLQRFLLEMGRGLIDRFRHEYASQLNLYMNYFKHEVMQEDDNPPIGLLLCTDYGETTVQYATEGLSQNLFVSKYRLQLPSEDDIRKYMLENITEEQFKEMMEEDLNHET